jgi:YfiH family protein
VPSRVRACSSLRAGGVSTGAHASLNVGEHVGDAPERVAENRARLAAALALPSEPCWLEQVHGTTVIDADRPWSQAADAAVSASPGRVLAIMTADCLPVLFADRAGKRVGAAHAGWRGLAAGVLRETVLAMQTPPAELIAWLGPAIGPAAFEVGREVRDAFLALGETRASAFERNERGRWQADLYALARLELEALGITGIHGGGLCTFSDTARFFSHRREAPCGRMVSLIWLIP